MNTTKKLRLIEFLDGLYFSTIITSLYAIASGLSLTNVVFAQGLYSITVLLMEVPTGVIADKYGRKVSVAMGYSMSVFGLLTFIISPSVAGLYLMRFLQSTGSALVSGASEALLYEASVAEKKIYKKESSTVFANGVLGLCIAGIISGLAYQVYGNDSFVPLLAATAIIQSIMVFIALSIREEKSRIPEQIQQDTHIWGILSSTVKLMKSNQTIFALTFVGMLAACNEYFLYGTYAPFLDSLHVNKFLIGAAFSGGLFVNFLLTRNVYRLENYFTLDKILVLIKSWAIAGYLLLAVLTPHLALVLTLVLAMGVFNIERPIISDYVNQEVNSSVRATVLSAMSLVSRFAKAILTFIMGAVIADTSVRNAYALQGMVILVGLVISYWLLVKCSCVRKIQHREVTA